jgi:hypothetical protein
MGNGLNVLCRDGGNGHEYTQEDENEDESSFFTQFDHELLMFNLGNNIVPGTFLLFFDN